jgi:S-adenosylmethionine/arginine decarboxylase-like enzyme
MIEHKHIVIRAKVKNPPKNVGWVEQWFKELIEKIDMKLLRGPFGCYLDKEGNRGITCVAIIETSHIALHIWDEEDPALVQFDVYTCGDLDINKVFDHLDVFDVVSKEWMYLDRKNSLEINERGSTP